MNCLVACSSDFSFYKSALKINDIVEFAANNNYQAVMLADYQNFYGLFPFINLCNKHNLKPLIGYYFDCDQGRFFIMCQNLEGYLNAIAFLNTDLSLESFKQYQDGNYLILHIANSKYLNQFLDCDIEFIKYFKSLKEQFKNLYCGVSLIQAATFNRAIKYFKDLIPNDLIAFNHYLMKNDNDQEILRLLESIEKSYSYNDLRIKANLYSSLLSYKQYNDLYVDLANKTNQLCLNCNIDFALLQSGLPKPKLKFEGESATILKQLALAGLKKRLNNHLSSEYLKRLESELNTIIKLGFSDYFLIVYDIVNFASKQKILRSLGRGSACGSLVAYSLGIIDIDPLQYNLLFERFLNSDRVSMPDIDLDFDAKRRDEIIDYLFATYGSEHCAYLSTFVYFKNNKTISDVAISLELDDKSLKKILNKMNFNLSIKENLLHNQELKDLIINHKLMQKVLLMASKIEGLVRQNSIHPAGIILSSKKINQVVASYSTSDQKICAMIDKEHINQVGLIKIDCLSLKNLSLLDEVLRKVSINFADISLNDTQTYNLLVSGNTLAIFQFETFSFKKLLKFLKPNNILQLINLNALNRPIAKKYVQPYFINNQNDDWKNNYNPIVYNLVKDTNGILLFEEQMMQICQQYAGFSLKEADSFRVALKKNNNNLVAKYKQKFLNATNDTKVLDLIIEFSQYSFNHSHAVAYTILAYKMAYLKTYYPLEYYLIAFNYANKIELLKEMSNLSLSVIKPSLIGDKENLVVDNKLFLGLKMIKGINTQLLSKIDSIKEDLKNNIDYFYWLTVLFSLKFSKNDVFLLIYAGALDLLNLTRMTMINNLDDVFQYSQIVTIFSDNQINYNFDLVSKPKLIHYSENLVLRSKNERDVLGVYLSSHPIKVLRKQLNVLPINYSLSKFEILIFINNVKVVTTKKNTKMAFIDCEDEFDKYELIVFSDLFQKIQAEIVVDKVYRALVKLESKTKFICLSLERIDLK